MEKFVAQFVAANDEMVCETISVATRLLDIPEWDSLAVLITMTMVETKFEVDLSGEEIRSCETLRDLAFLVEAKRNGRSSK